MKAGKIKSKAITLGNSGSEPLNWTAAITSGPGFVSLSQTSGTNLAGGTTTSINVLVDATNASPGTYNATVNITAIDPLTGNAVAGSPASVTITITISAPASMQLSATNLSFKVKNGNNTSSQPITITNTGGGTLTWSVGTPSATWLTVSPASGSNDPSISSSTTFTVNVADLPKGKYSATVVVTPSDGSAVTINITLKVN